MKTLLFSLITLSLFAFTSRFNLNSYETSLDSTEKIVKQIIQYNDGTISTTVMSIGELQKLDFSKKMYKINNCTFETPTGGCRQTASTCSEALGKFADCLCRTGYPDWCQGTPKTGAIE